MRNDPDEVAKWAEYPTIHQDLTARHIWLKEWAIRNADRLFEDCNYYDAKAAGWWVWGISSWIGGGWCVHSGGKSKPYYTSNPGGGRGVQSQRKLGDARPHSGRPGTGVGVQAHSDKRPVVGKNLTGSGVQAQRNARDVGKNLTGIGVQVQKNTKYKPTGQRPTIGKNLTGTGVQAQRKDASEKVASGPRPYLSSNIGSGVGVQPRRERPAMRGDSPGKGQGIQAQISGDSEDEYEQDIHLVSLQTWFNMLQSRLYKVVVLNRDWSRLLTNAVLAQYESKKYSVGVFLDPPYLVGNRNTSHLYQSDQRRRNGSLGLA